MIKLIIIRIAEAMVEQNLRAWEIGTASFGTVADGNGIINVYLHEFINAFGTMATDIDAHLPHGFNGKGIHPKRIRTRTRYFITIPMQCPQETFSHLRTG